MWVGIKSAASQVLRAAPPLHAGAKRAYEFARRWVSPDRESDWIARVFGTRRDVSFIQIGAHDGRTNDSLHDSIRNRSWRGILVEPVHDLFLKLQENYNGSTGLKFEQSAICASDGEVTFWVVANTDGASPDWVSQLGSLSKEIVLSHSEWVPELGGKLRPIQVNGITFSTLIAKHGVDRVDLILIDTEGHDYEILKQILAESFRPKMIIYEQIHLSVENRIAAKKALAADGYSVRDVGLNVIAILTVG
jgi:FkbM family methyltransferase